MARIPQFTRKVFLSRAGNSSASAAFAAGGGNEARGHALDAQRFDERARTLGGYAEEIAKQKAADAKIRAEDRFNQMQRETIIPQYQERRNKAQENPNGFAQGFDEYYQSELSRIEEEVGSSEGDEGFDLDHFRRLVDRDRTSQFQKAYDFENGQRLKNTFTGVEKAIDDMNVNFTLDPDATYQDLVEHQNKIAEYAKTVGTDILSPQDTLKLTEYGIDNAAREFMHRQLQEDPKKARRVIEYGQGGRDALTEFIMMDMEGGAKVAAEPDGAIAKYGINSLAYAKRHGIEHEAAKKAVRNLTQEGAAEELKSYYYDPKLDEFEPTFQAVAYDALVNHGNDKDTWRMIEEANGNPYTLIKLRQEKYAGLINANPGKYEQYGAGWDNRMNELADYVQTMDGGGQEFLKHAPLIDSTILGDVRAKIPKALADKEKSIAEEIEKANTIDAYTVKQNEDELTKLIYSEDATHEEKIQALREADFKGLIGDKFATEAESVVNGYKKLKKVDYDPNEIANLYARKETMFNKSNKSGKRRITVSEDMLDDIGDLMVEVMQKEQSELITKSEAKTLLKSLSTDLAAAGNKIGKGNWFSEYTHDEKAFRYFAETTDRPDLRNEMFRRYTEASTLLDDMEAAGASKDEIQSESQKIIQSVVKQSLAEQVPGTASLDALPNQVFTVNGDRIFVGAHGNKPKPNASITAAGEIRVIDGVKFRMNPDGKSGVRIE